MRNGIKGEFICENVVIEIDGETVRSSIPSVIALEFTGTGNQYALKEP